MYPTVPDVWHVARPVFVQARMANRSPPRSCRAYSSILYFPAARTSANDVRTSPILKGTEAPNGDIFLFEASSDVAGAYREAFRVEGAKDTLITFIFRKSSRVEFEASFLTSAWVPCDFFAIEFNVQNNVLETWYLAFVEILSCLENY